MSRLVPIGFAVSTALTSIASSQTSARHIASFCVLADVPYTEAAAEKLKEEIKHLPAECEVLFHLGDIKDGRACAEAQYASVASILRQSPVPVFIVPGDNEWNDCLDPTLAWKWWTRYFMRFENNWSHSFEVARQTIREENFAFLHKGILFIGINAVQGGLSKSEEKQRLAENLAWIKQQYSAHPKARQFVLLAHGGPNSSRTTFYDEVAAATAAADKPFLLLHGNHHRWVHNRPWSKAPKMLRVQVNDQATPAIVRVFDDATRPFVLYPDTLIHNGVLKSMALWTTTGYALNPAIEKFNTTGLSLNPCYAATLGWRTATEQTDHRLQQPLILDPTVVHELTFDLAIEFRGDKAGPVEVEAEFGETDAGKKSFKDIGSGTLRRHWFARFQPRRADTDLTIEMRRDAVASPQSPRIRIDNVKVTLRRDVALAFQGDNRVGNNIEYVAWGQPYLPYAVFLSGSLLPRDLYLLRLDGGFSLVLGSGSLVIQSGVLDQNGASRVNLGPAPPSIAGLMLHWQALQADLTRLIGGIGCEVSQGFYR